MADADFSLPLQAAKYKVGREIRHNLNFTKVNLNEIASACLIVNGFIFLF
jgi:hypothetical protein